MIGKINDMTISNDQGVVGPETGTGSAIGSFCAQFYSIMKRALEERSKRTGVVGVWWLDNDVLRRTRFGGREGSS